MAAALSFILLLFTLALYAVFGRLLGLDRLKLV
jgi:putative spermidine/putrescine transport system permease protein